MGFNPTHDSTAPSSQPSLVIITTTAAREAEVLSLTRQLDQSHRDVAMYKVEIAKLRDTLVEVGRKLKLQHHANITKGDSTAATATTPSASSNVTMPVVAAAQPPPDEPGLIRRMQLHSRPSR